MAESNKIKSGIIMDLNRYFAFFQILGLLTLPSVLMPGKDEALECNSLPFFKEVFNEDAALSIVCIYFVQTQVY